MFWTVAGDNVTSLALTDFDADGENEVGGEAGAGDGSEIIGGGRECVLCWRWWGVVGRAQLGDQFVYFPVCEVLLINVYIYLNACIINIFVIYYLSFVATDCFDHQFIYRAISTTTTNITCKVCDFTTKNILHWLWLL